MARLSASTFVTIGAIVSIGAVVIGYPFRDSRANGFFTALVVLGALLFVGGLLALEAEQRAEFKRRPPTVRGIAP